MAEQSDEIDVDLIAAVDDAGLRLRCYEACAVQGLPFEATLAQAGRLYRWIWEGEPVGPDEGEKVPTPLKLVSH